MDNVKNTYQIDDQLNNNSNLLISSSERIIMSNKNFFLKCNDYFKQIINTIDIINNLDKKENEKKKNNNNNENENENMSDIESKENKEEKNVNPNTTLPKNIIEQEFSKMFIDENEQLEKLLKIMVKDIPKDKKNLVSYIKELIKYTQEDEELKNMFNLEELQNDLLYHFYKDPEGKKLKTTFYNQFQLKRFPELKDILNHFTIFRESTIEHIKQIIKIINNAENNENLTNIINIKNNKIVKKLKENSKLILLSNKNVLKNINDFQEKASNEINEKNNIRYMQSLEKNKIVQGIKSGTTSQKDTSYSELEFMGNGKIDEDDIFDNQVEKKEKKVVKKKVNSIEENIVNKLYSPFLAKTFYLRQLNKNMKGIKSLTTYNCKANHTLIKRAGEVDITTHQMLVYNNPLINPNKLANPTYNSLVKLAISTQNMNKKNEKKFKHNFTQRYNEIKK